MLPELLDHFHVRHISHAQDFFLPRIALAAISNCVPFSSSSRLTHGTPRSKLLFEGGGLAFSFCRQELLSNLAMGFYCMQYVVPKPRQPLDEVMYLGNV